MENIAEKMEEKTANKTTWVAFVKSADSNTYLITAGTRKKLEKALRDDRTIVEALFVMRGKYFDIKKVTTFQVDA